MPLLIVAQSGRFLAQQAVKHGFRVRIADNFGDIDTLAVADLFQQLPVFSQLTETVFLDVVTKLANAEICQLIIGTGLEVCFTWLNKLPENVQFIGTSNTALAKTINKPDWFLLLSALKLPFPETRFNVPEDPIGWLYKKFSGWGGSHIRKAALASDNNTGYFQRFVVGQSASALFLADGKRAKIISLNRQYCRHTTSSDFSLLAVSNTFIVTVKQFRQLSWATQQLTESLFLTGWQSLDFIIADNGDIQLLELNSRPSASLQCLPADWPFISWHIAACQKRLLDIAELPEASPKMLYNVYASTQPLKIPEHFSWPDYTADRPPAGVIIQPDEILCSFLLPVKNDSQQTLNLAQQLATQLQIKLSVPLESPAAATIFTSS